MSAAVMVALPDALDVRLATAGDAALVQTFFAADAANQRLRFLDRPGEAGRHRYVAAPDVDHATTEDFVGWLGKHCVAAGRLAFDATCSRAEASIAVQGDHQRKGLSWQLLEHMRAIAIARGAHVLEAIIRQQDHDLASVMRGRRFRFKEIAGEPHLLIVSDRLIAC